MKTLLRIILWFVALLVIAGVIVYADGSSLPVNHSISVLGIIPAPPARTFDIIGDVANGATWRSEIKSVTMLPPDNGMDHWVEDLGDGEKMVFSATEIDTADPHGHLVRKVKLDGDPRFGGTWTYDVWPGPTPSQSMLKITEDGFINPPIYRFMMAYVFGPTKNLKDYMGELQVAAPKS